MLFRNLFVPFSITGDITDVKVTHDAVGTNTHLYTTSGMSDDCGLVFFHFVSADLGEAADKELLLRVLTAETRCVHWPWFSEVF